LARVASTAFLVALLAASAAAFALTEGAKLELAPIYKTNVSKVFSPGITEAHIDFKLRKADRLSVWVTRGGKRVVTIVPGRTFGPGWVRLVFTGVTSTGLDLPDGTYVPVVHLGRTHRTITIPSEIQLDTKPPLIKVRRRIYTHISPDGDGRRDVFRVPYAVDGPARAILFVGTRRVEVTYRQKLHGELDWNGKLGGRPVRPGNYVLYAAASDLAGNTSKPYPFAVVRVRYVVLGRTRILVRPGGRFAVRVLTDAATIRWRLHGGTGTARAHTLRLRAPKSAGVYRLYVEAAGHAAKALVVVA
jgi:hypothetical protein